ncbi:glycine/D-amino acid oxidase [Ameyamaea chiangmaiensis NBRC 103196]|uniref:FAD-binding oxidoreductase n=1 Tax=Ameyamaea chiangmaiensis TaxID=442969 RepID=A0A850P7I3_9PROT|nr:FAD-binding oxidoreductase [Ameyamaea chiangmaiensis]MBS4075090.1 FAD-binding oxidoreductase [Ameyamaea chiangmaiensis]NVN40557.1 FAD-binding oxidoreductase [Ameyamaea chiangmaiensis]GBQ65503.1 glycine/D-amino acid oxidase [Ameyamaea chiangmaiensis NBRC 103196]
MVTASAGRPERFDVIIVGAGLIGLCTALALRQRGVSVLVCDKGAVGAEQSSRNWGWIRSLNRTPAEIPLLIESRRLWREWAQLGDFGYRQTGLFSLCDNEDEVAAHESWLRRVASFDLDAQMLDADQIAQHVPQARKRWLAGAYAPLDAVAEPDRATGFVADRAVASGAVVQSDMAVRELDIQGGQIAGVVTECGRVRADHVVVAAGAWSRLLCKTAKVTLPQLQVIASVLRTARLDGGPTHALGCRDFSMRPRLDGGFTVARRNSSVTRITPDTLRFVRLYMKSFLQNRKLLTVKLGRDFLRTLERDREFGPGRGNRFDDYRSVEPAPDMGTLSDALSALMVAFPAFATAHIAHAWAGVIDVMPDALPVLSMVDGCPGLSLATGFSAHGFGIAPASGALMAELLLDGRTRFNDGDFRLSRFGNL